MPANQELTIHATYTGTEPNLKPAASAFAEAIQRAVNADGTFIDPELEAEFQEWRKTHGQDIHLVGVDPDHRALRA